MDMGGITLINAVFQYTFLQNALLGALLASVLCGIIGTIIIEKKMVMISGGIAHAAFGGIGMGYFFGIEPIIGAFIFSVFSALSISAINRKAKTNTDVLFGIFWSVGMALGVLFIAITPGYPPNISSYLFGDILTISSIDLYVIIALDVLVVFSVSLFFNVLKVYIFDEELASISGIRVEVTEYIFFTLVAITVVALIRVVGIIMTTALLTAPSAIAKMFSYDFKRIMIISIAIGAGICIAGLWLSYELNIASGVAIVLVAGFIYLSSSIVKSVHKRRGRF